MKKLLDILVLAFVSVTFFGCTLMMEDFEVPEAERGVDAPYTEVIPDVGYVTYQYNEGVQPITSDMLNFIAQVEADTILYFYDYIPQENLPKAGQLVAAGCTPTIPHGLNSKVLSVENVGGLYKVVTTDVGEDVIYKELEYEFDFNYAIDPNTHPAEPDSLTLDSMGLKPIDLAITDWGQYEKLSRKKMRMRADKDDNFNEDEYEEEKQEEDVPFAILIDTRDFQLGKTGSASGVVDLLRNKLVSKMSTVLKSYPNDYYVTFGYTNKTTRNIYTKKSKKNKEEVNWIDTETTQTFMIEGGWGKGASFFDVKEKLKNSKLSTEEQLLNELEKICEQGQKATEVAKYVNNLKFDKFTKESWSQYKERFKNHKKVEKDGIRGIGIYIPIPCAPAIEIYFRAGWDFGYKVNLSGGYAYSVTTKNRQGSREKDGEVTPIKSDFRQERKTSHSLYLQGNAEVTIEAGVEIGTRVVKSFTAGGYFYGKAGVTANIFFDALGDRKLFNEQNAIRAYVEAGANLRFGVEPLGLKIWNKDIPIKTWTLFEAKFQPVPGFTTSAVPGSLNIEANSTSVNYEYALNTTNTIIPGASFFLTPDYKPKLQIYKNSLDERSLITTLDPGKGSTKEKFKFEYTFKDGEYNADDAFVAVPYIESSFFGNIFYEDLAYILDTPTPKVKLTGLQQTRGEEVIGYNQLEGFDDIPESFDNLAIYEFATMVYVSQRGLMKGWGLEIEVYHPQKGMIVNRKLPINRSRSGVYTITSKFLVNYIPRGEDYPLIVTVRPYYTDTDGNHVSEERDEIELKIPVNQPFAGGGTKVEVQL